MADAFADEVRLATRDALQHLDERLARARPRTPGDTHPAPPVRSALCELGAFGLEAPESVGGAGRSFADACAVLAEVGRLALPHVALAPLALGVGAALLDYDADRRRANLKAIASGEWMSTAALTGPDGTPHAAGVAAKPDGAGFRLSGAVGFVPDAAAADVLAVAARTPGADRPDCLFYVARTAPGVHVEAQRTVDPSQSLAVVRLDDVAVTDADAVAPPGAARAAVATMLARAAVAAAADSVGSAGRALELTVDHLQTRQQFGRPIGSFQALKHRCANMQVWLQMARAAVEHAARVIDDPRQGAAAAAIAKSYCGRYCPKIVEEAVQLHGAIAFTTEHVLHLHLKRQQLDAALFGDPLWHRATITRLAVPAP